MPADNRNGFDNGWDRPGRGYGPFGRGWPFKRERTGEHPPAAQQLDGSSSGQLGPGKLNTGQLCFGPSDRRLLDRRGCLLAGTGGLAAWLAGASVSLAGSDRPASPNEKSPAELLTDATWGAIDKAHQYLVRKQIRDGRYRGALGTSGYASGVAATSLAGLSFMAGGSVPGDGKFGRNVDLCAEYVLNNVQDSGYIALADNSVHENMYGHGFAMLFLAQVYGMTRKREVGEKLRKAVDLTVKAQNNQGGWRYQPQPVDADLSVTICQIMGLRAARDAGVYVPDDVREKCIAYVRKSRNRDGSFSYMPGAGHGSLAMTAAGVTSLYSAGIYEGPEIEQALKIIDRSRPGRAGNFGGHYFYTHYYAVQAMWHAGGEYWNNWYPAIRDELVRSQQGDGSWANDGGGPEYSAAMATIILQIPLNYLPVFAA